LSFIKKIIVAVILGLFPLVAQAEEISLFDPRNGAVAYVADDLTVYIWNGDPVGYLSGSDDRFSIYGFNGTHLGWFIHGMVLDHKGNFVGFTRETSGSIRTPIESGKGVKADAPEKLRKEFAPPEPILTNQWSNLSLESLLRADPQ
jgi:hypothetical protein